MVTKTITYVDYDNNEVTDEFCFNLNRAEIIRLNMEYGGDFEKAANAIVASKDTNAIFTLFEKLIRMSVGVKSPDGKRFVKTEDARSAFFDSEAYAEFLLELIQDKDKMQAFVTNIIHKVGPDAIAPATNA